MQLNFILPNIGSSAKRAIIFTAITEEEDVGLFAAMNAFSKGYLVLSARPAGCPSIKWVHPESSGMQVDFAVPAIGSEGKHAITFTAQTEETDAVLLAVMSAFYDGALALSAEPEGFPAFTWFYPLSARSELVDPQGNPI